MHLKNKGLLQSSPVWKTQNSELSLLDKISSYPDLLFHIAQIIFTLAYLLFWIRIALRKENKNSMIALKM
jgi:hypothetical protein